ncbi:hypothetical protein [uncultured Olleya sp.]|uniref:hypothetical protein n=1 Tax=uncultured Olleya sp. TaxID=757243 RepID=UPI0025989CC5|nr:hypothetical protein [uncultured Olleya sp.]
MKELHQTLHNTLLLSEFIAAVVGVIYMYRLRKSHWKWFSVYLLIIFFQDYFWTYNQHFSKKIYFSYFGLPLQFIFMYWLYALKSLKNKRLFTICVLLFILTVGLFIVFKDLNEIPSLSMNIGSAILILLLILEYIKQIKTDDVLKFKENKMFYINIGLVLFYIGSYPYHVFSAELYENHINAWSIYYIYFLVSNSIMYLLFSVSFIWGKTQS